MPRRRPAGLDVDRRPTALVLKSVMAVSSFPVAIGVRPLPGSLDSGSGIFGQVAASVLCAGCIISIVGLLYGYFSDILDGLAVEALGLIGVGAGSGMYAVALWQVQDFTQARIAFGLSLGVSMFAWVQYVLIAIHRRRVRLADAVGAGDGQ